MSNQIIENISSTKLTFESIWAAYTSLLEERPGKALLLQDGCAVFIENRNIYAVTVSPAGEVEMVSAGCISPVAWDDERGCWDTDDSPEITLAPVKTPVFIDLPATESAGVDQWKEFEHAGRRWSFNGDELAGWDDEDSQFHFVAYHGQVEPSAQTLTAIIDTL